MKNFNYESKDADLQHNLKIKNILFYLKKLFQGCLSLGDEALFHLARFCPDLERINLQGCRNIQVGSSVVAHSSSRVRIPGALRNKWKFRRTKKLKFENCLLQNMFQNASKHISRDI